MSFIASERNVRLSTNQDVSNVGADFTFYQAEKVVIRVDLSSQFRQMIPMPEGGTCKLEAWIDGTPSVLWIDKVGTVNATKQYAEIELEPAESNITQLGDFLYRLKVFDTAAPTPNMAIAASGTITVLYSPDSEDVSYVGTTAFFVAADVPYDNTDSGLAATDVQEAIDEVAGVFTDYTFTEPVRFEGTDPTYYMTIESNRIRVYLDLGGLDPILFEMGASNSGISFSMAGGLGLDIEGPTQVRQNPSESRAAGSGAFTDAGKVIYFTSGTSETLATLDEGVFRWVNTTSNPITLLTGANNWQGVNQDAVLPAGASITAQYTTANGWWIL